MSEDQNQNCPPGNITDITDPGAGGEEVYDDITFPELNFSNFLAPIQEIDTQPYGTSRGIREINIFDQFHFLRTRNNLFNTDSNGQESITIPGYHRQTDRSFKSPRISDSYQIIQNAEVQTLNTQEDRFRVENNMFWHLKGTEAQPIQEEWASANLLQELQQKKYNFTLEATQANQALGKYKECYPIGSVKIEIESLEDQLSVADIKDRIISNNLSYEDFNTSVEQPLLASENSLFQLPADELGHSYTVDFSAVIGERVTDPENEIKPEYLLSSIYRQYYRIASQTSQDCEIEDKTQKFISANLVDIDRANDSEVLSNRNPNYIQISIKRPKIEKVDSIMEMFETTQIDKYFLEIFSKTSPYYIGKQVIQLADEISPETQQSVRTNDRFSIGFLRTTSKDFVQQIRDMSTSNQNFSTFSSDVFNSKQDYPLKFKNYRDLDALHTSDFVDNLPDFTQKYEAFCSTISRTYSEMISGKKAQSFIIGYKIEKFNSNSSNTPVQTFYIMERPASGVSGDPEAINFKDAQVIYGRTYIYRIYSIVMVFGTLYNYLGQGEMRVNYNDSCRIYQVPFYQKTVSLTDLPPLAPEVTFSPYQGISNKVQILFNHAVGNKKEKPILINNGDAAVFDKMRTTQFLEETEEINYLSDTVPQTYEIFMSTSRPRRYRDFGERPPLTIQTNGRISVIREVYLQPNVDYYFTFRSRETAGISNPSTVFKLRMVDTPNGIFMVLREYDMYTETETYTKLDFERSLSISPALRQRTIIYPEGTDIGSLEFSRTVPSGTLKVGPDTNSIWDKKYKFRITSKTSGKKLDLNIRFKQNTLENFEIFDFTPELCDPAEARRLEITPECTDQISGPHFSYSAFGSAPSYSPTGFCVANDIKSLRFDNLFGGTITKIVNFNSPRENISFKNWLLNIDEIREYCECPENPDNILNFLPPGAYDQKALRDNGQDFLAIFGDYSTITAANATGVPRHLGDAVIPAQAAMTENLTYWTETQTEQELQQLYDRVSSNPEEATIEDRLKFQTEWFPHLFVFDDQNILEGAGDEPLSYKPEEKQYKCLNVVRALLKSISFSGQTQRRTASFTDPNDTSRTITLTEEQMPSNYINLFDEDAARNRFGQPGSTSFPCAEGYEFSQAAGKCVKKECQNQFQRLTDCGECECVGSAESPIVDSDGNQRITHFVDQDGVCKEIKCPPGRVLQSDGTCACNSADNLEEFKGECVEKCPEGFQRNNSTGDCERIPCGSFKFRPFRMREGIQPVLGFDEQEQNIFVNRIDYIVNDDAVLEDEAGNSIRVGDLLVDSEDAIELVYDHVELDPLTILFYIFGGDIDGASIEDSNFDIIQLRDAFDPQDNTPIFSALNQIPDDLTDEQREAEEARLRESFKVLMNFYQESGSPTLCTTQTEFEYTFKRECPEFFRNVDGGAPNNGVTFTIPFITATIPGGLTMNLGTAEEPDKRTYTSEQMARFFYARERVRMIETMDYYCDRFMEVYQTEGADYIANNLANRNPFDVGETALLHPGALSIANPVDNEHPFTVMVQKADGEGQEAYKITDFGRRLFEYMNKRCEKPECETLQLDKLGNIIGRVTGPNENGQCVLECSDGYRLDFTDRTGTLGQCVPIQQQGGGEIPDGIFNVPDGGSDVDPDLIAGLDSCNPSTQKRAQPFYRYSFGIIGDVVEVKMTNNNEDLTEVLDNFDSKSFVMWGPEFEAEAVPLISNSGVTIINSFGAIVEYGYDRTTRLYDTAVDSTTIVPPGGREFFGKFGLPSLFYSPARILKSKEDETQNFLLPRHLQSEFQLVFGDAPASNAGLEGFIEMQHFGFTQRAQGGNFLTFDPNGNTHFQFQRNTPDAGGYFHTYHKGLNCTPPQPGGENVGVIRHSDCINADEVERYRIPGATTSETAFVTAKYEDQVWFDGVTVGGNTNAGLYCLKIEKYYVDNQVEKPLETRIYTRKDIAICGEHITRDIIYTTGGERVLRNDLNTVGPNATIPAGDGIRKVLNTNSSKISVYTFDNPVTLDQVREVRQSVKNDINNFVSYNTVCVPRHVFAGNFPGV